MQNLSKRQLFYCSILPVIFLMMIVNHNQPTKTITSAPKNHFGLIVIGTDPEGIAAAIGAAQAGDDVLLIDGQLSCDGNAPEPASCAYPAEKRMGGLMTASALTVVDFNQNPFASGIEPFFWDRGVFLELWKKLGRTFSFDRKAIEQTFHQMVKKRSNIRLVESAKEIHIQSEKKSDGTIQFQSVTFSINGKKTTAKAPYLIDATQNADVAHEMGIAFREPKEKMAVSPIIHLGGISDAAWKALGQGPRKSGWSKNTYYGFGEGWKYKPTNPERLRLRGLNIGRDLDGTVWINALLVFGVDPFNPRSVNEAFEISEKEMPHILKYLKGIDPLFEKAEFLGFATELYVRQTRQLDGMKMLRGDDALAERISLDRIAICSYPVDVQARNPQDSGTVLFSPRMYSIPFGAIVPKNANNVMVIGRSASYDRSAQGSARVIPCGMQTGQAAGVVANLAKTNLQTSDLRILQANQAFIRKMQWNLNLQNAWVNKLPTRDILWYQKSPDKEWVNFAVNYLGEGLGYSRKPMPEYLSNGSLTNGRFCNWMRRWSDMQDTVTVPNDCTNQQIRTVAWNKSSIQPQKIQNAVISFIPKSLQNDWKENSKSYLSQSELPLRQAVHWLLMTQTYISQQKNE